MPAGVVSDLMRKRKDGEDAKVSFVELFYDLVFVFAITQLSRYLFQNLTPLGALETTLMFIAIWWVWVDTCWVTNWLDPDRTPVRGLLITLMLVGLVISISIPEAFGDRALSFGLAVAATHVGRSLFMLWAFRRRKKQSFLKFQRVLIWHAVSGAFWVAGGLADPQMRLVLWGVGALIESLASGAGFWVPGMGRSGSGDWGVDGQHLAERCGLFIIIALGESILVTGARFSELNLGIGRGLLICFIGSVAMWWIYFDITADHARRAVARHHDPDRIARLAYTYFHIPMVMGIIAYAVSDQLALDYPDGPLPLSYALVILIGPTLFLVGNILFKRAVSGRSPRSHLLGLALLALCALYALIATPLTLTLSTTMVLIVVAVTETIGLRRSLPPEERI